MVVVWCAEWQERTVLAQVDNLAVVQIISGSIQYQESIFFIVSACILSSSSSPGGTTRLTFGVQTRLDLRGVDQATFQED